MKRHAKASSAFTFGRSGSAAGRVARSFAARGASRDGDGSGAPAGGRARAGLLVLAAMAFMVLALAPAASATKYVDGFIGNPTNSSGNLGGLFNNPRGVAVNTSGAGGVPVGTVYVVDGSNNRIQQFSPAGSFVRAWGRDVVAKTVNEQQSLKVSATGGTYTLTFNGSTTAPIAHNAFGSTIDDALDALPSIGGDANVAVSETASGTYTITLQGALAAANQPQVTVDTSSLTGTATVTTIADGTPTTTGDTNEKQSVTVGGAPTGGTFTLTFGASTTAPIAFNASAADVKAALAALPSVGAGNVEVTGAGPYAVEFVGAKGSVDQAQLTANGAELTPSGTVTVATAQDGASFETCTVAGQCKAGTTTSTATLGNAGTFSNPRGIAVDQTTGNLYVTGGSFLRVDSFSATGTFIRSWGQDVVSSGPGNTGTGPEVCTTADICKAGTTGTVGGAFRSTFEGHPAVVPIGAPNAGNVLIADGVNARIQEFTGSGTFVRTFGWDVQSPAGGAFEICTVAAECKAGVHGAGGFDGSPPGQFIAEGGSPSPVYIAADSSGVIYAADSAAVFQKTRRVQKFTPGIGQALTPAAFIPDFSPFGPGFEPTAIAVNPATNHVYVVRSYANSDPNIAIPPCLDGSAPGFAERRILEFDSTGKLLDTHGICAKLGSAFGLTVGPSANRLYLSSNSPGAGGTTHRVYVFDDDGAGPATVDLEPPTNVQGHSVDLKGTVTPNGPVGFTTRYRFEISKNGIDWTPLSGLINIGGGSSPVAVQAAATGLEANTFYRARIATSKSFENPIVPSAELTFITDSPAPEVETVHPRVRGDVGATLAAFVNPNNLPTTYRFEYGRTSAYGSTAPVPDGDLSGGTNRLVLEAIEGLEPETTYHYRIVATNAEGTTVGGDKAFTTRPPLAGEAARGYEMVTPPFKVVRAVGLPYAKVRDNPNAAVASLDGNAVTWNVSFFPLSDDVLAPITGDSRLIRRTASGWVNSTRNTLPLIPESEGGLGPSFVTKVNPIGTSGDFETLAWDLFDGRKAAHLPTEGQYPNKAYTRRDGTGTKGFTPWLTNPEQQIVNQGFPPQTTLLQAGAESALFNDDGSAMARWGHYRGLAEVPGTPGDEDPSDNQQLRGQRGGGTPYMQTAADPAALPAAPKELVSECTGELGGGSGPAAAPTLIPARIGSGLATDTIGTQPCAAAEGSAPPAVGSGDVNPNSATITNVVTDGGAFTVGKQIWGNGIPGGTTIAAVGPDSITMSAPAEGVAFKALVELTSGSKVGVMLFVLEGRELPGHKLIGPGIPAGTTYVGQGEGGGTFNMSAAATASGLVEITGLDPFGPGPGVDLWSDDQHLTSVRGAGVGDRTGQREGLSATALSNDGQHVFFQSPDRAATKGSEGDLDGSLKACATPTGVSTACPPQLFVRSHDSSGQALVRWISQSRSVPVGDGAYGGGPIAGQQVGLMGDGAFFQGASRDGRVVYFKTNAPLTPDDPNGTGTPGPKTTGSASGNSWDLYRYELPADPDADPAEGTLLRVSGGPTGTADPSTHGFDSKSASVRFHSDDGERVYFLTTAAIAGADTSPPEGGATAPGGTVGDPFTRNLYLFDAGASGSDRWTFIARIPVGADHTLNGCASIGDVLDDHIETVPVKLQPTVGNCFRGTPEGAGVVFATNGQLTEDDRDQASDVYLYDADEDELVRVSAPPPGAEPYPCEQNQNTGAITGFCNGDLGRNQGRGFFSSPSGPWDTARGWGGMRYYNVAEDARGVVSVFFASKLELVPQDTNGDHMDVYQWRQGELSLVSPGNASYDAWYSGSSVDGRDAFFVTGQPIDPREIDTDDLDVYDARVGGGFPYVPPAEPCDVLALGCESAAIGTTAPTGAATRAANGAGNVKPARTGKRPCPKGKTRRKGKCVKKGSAKRANHNRRAGR